MKFIHIADIHLGARPEAGRLLGTRRTQEIWNGLEKIITICKEKQTDLLLVAGDLFHRQPLMRELKEVNHLFGTISDTQVVIIVGNHDYMKQDSYYRTFHWAENVHMILDEELTCVELPKLETAVYGLSYGAREITEAKYDSALPQKRQKYEILLAHGGDQNHIPIQKQKLLNLGYDYIALGHIHKPQMLQENLAYYAGALEPIDRNDTGAHGYVEGEITEQGCKARFVPCAEREYVHLDVHVDRGMTRYALIEHLREQMKVHGAQNIYKITLRGLRDPDIVFETESMETCGNIVELIDATKPAYDFERLLQQNRDNLLGMYIESLKDCDEDSLEYLALCEGVQALMETRRG